MARIIDGDRVLVSCSWCHELVEVRARIQYCPTCGHRADVARVDCDCPKCWKPDDVAADRGRRG
jgi:NADH pyrophosphatase NudC (nudix superfamily)